MRKFLAVLGTARLIAYGSQVAGAADPPPINDTTGDGVNGVWHIARP
jgi:predicted lipoprotein with Yx(FWY)xxD motif